MIRALLNSIYGSTPAEFKSVFGLSDSVARLQAATGRSAFSVLREQAAAGPVSESRVRLQRVTPMIGNSFKPFFFGRFESRGESVYLTGRFTMLGLSKAFMTLWLAGVLATGIALAAIAIARPGATWLPALGSLGIFAAGISLVRLGKWFARNDADWLSNVIRTALGGPVMAQALESAAAQAPRAYSASNIPTVLRVTALVLLLMGAMGVWSAASGICSWHASCVHTVITRFSSWPLRLATGAYGLAMLGLAFGVYRRRQWAWWLGVVLFGLAGLTSLLQAFTSPQFPDNAFFRIIFGALALVITLYWGWWWYAQRIHFLSNSELLSESPRSDRFGS